ncbi:MAG: hypothetical protein BWK76_25110 [Desulfobulbaceae bacterium A2]|nr:MAG: hypothetical protein BWK76_25110 [Desulfobulbaceae bacterium A2]
MLRLLFILLSVLALPGVVAAAGRRPVLDDIVITSSASHLLLHSEVRDCCSEEMQLALHRGSPLVFTFQIELDRVREWWTNRSILSLSVQHTLSYDPQTQNYLVTLQERNNQLVRTPSLADAMKLMSQLRGIKLVPGTSMEPERSYILRVKAVLAEKTLPLGLHHVVPLISLANVETDWRLVEFRY